MPLFSVQKSKCGPMYKSHDVRWQKVVLFSQGSSHLTPVKLRTTKQLVSLNPDFILRANLLLENADCITGNSNFIRYESFNQVITK